MQGVEADLSARRPHQETERSYERWVMRAAELVHGDYPDDRGEAERIILLHLRDGLVGSIPPTDFWGEDGSTLEEAGGYFSDYGEDHVQATRSLACEDADGLRALHERIARELPRRQITVEEAANDALEAVEGMQGVLERVREASDVLDTQEEM